MILIVVRKVGWNKSPCWVDEDGERVSTRHKTLGTALSYVEGWAKRAERLNGCHDDLRANLANALEKGNEPDWRIRQLEHNLEANAKYRSSLTLTGKRPDKLLRLVTRTFVEQPTMAEMKIALDTIRAEFGETS